MFGTNEIVGKAYFKNALWPPESLMVTSVFYTLQGEGPLGGEPAVFVRLSKCNLTCSFCDTFFDDGDVLSYEQLDKLIENSINDYYKDKPFPVWLEDRGINLVITGGEPLLQDNLTGYINRVADRFKNVQIESNGIPNTVVPDGVILVCSPKCAEKDGKPTKYLAPSKTILNRADCLKFVVSADPNSPYHTVPDWAIEWKKNNPLKPIFCSPMNVYNTFPQKIKLLRAEKGTITLSERSTVDEVISFWEPNLLNLEQNQANHEYAGRYCIDNGFKLSLQQHLYCSLA